MTIINWDEVFAECRPMVFGYLRSRLSDAQQAEDLTQHVLLKAYRNRERYAPEKSSASTWVYNIARNALIDYFRTSRNNVSLDALVESGGFHAAADGEPDDIVVTAEMQDMLAEALEKLPEQERDIVVLHYFDGMSLADIARRMDLPYGRIKRGNARAMAQLQMLLKEQGFSEYEY